MKPLLIILPLTLLLLLLPDLLHNSTRFRDNAFQADRRLRPLIALFTLIQIIYDYIMECIENHRIRRGGGFSVAPSPEKLIELTDRFCYKHLRRHLPDLRPDQRAAVVHLLLDHYGLQPHQLAPHFKRHRSTIHSDLNNFVTTLYRQKNLIHLQSKLKSYLISFNSYSPL